MYASATGQGSDQQLTDKSQSQEQNVSSFSGGQTGINEELEDTEASGPSKGELSEEAHLFAKFTCTYKIEDFLKHEGGGTSMTFPQNEVVQVTPCLPLFSPVQTLHLHLVISHVFRL